MSNIPLLLVVDGANGVYVPQRFVENYDMSLWNNIDQEEIDIVKAGPEQEDYWDAWDNIMNAAEYKHQDKIWRLYQDGDLFIVCNELMTDEEYVNLYGETRS